MPFANPVVAGQKLVIPSIQSVNYVPGVSGWAIFRDGSSEFASGTFRGPVVIIDPNTGATLASIGATGNGSFQNLAMTGDLVFGNTSLLTELNKRAKGVVAYFQYTSALPNAANGSYTNIASLPWISEGTNRLYKIKVGSIGAFNSSGTAKDWLNQLNVGGTTIFQNQQDVTGGGTQAVNCEYIGSFAAGTQIATWAAQGIGVAFSFVNGTTDPFVMTIEDVGPNNGITGNVGGPGASVKTKTYTATATRSYDSSGNFIGSPDGDNNIYYGGGGTRTFGNECDIVLFNGSQMRTDLTGATIITAKLWLYCFQSIDASGSYGFNLGFDTSLPATASWHGNSPTYFLDQTWPVPGWSSLDLTLGSPSAINQFINNGNNSLQASKLFSSENTGFRGFGFSSSYRPYIQVVYSS